ncbi:transcription termination factor NusA, partial [Candidatus Woesebacteria bacterium]|nr:transcription termination factor NusA [Candidatus Woesebacteria bacterium]
NGETKVFAWPIDTPEQRKDVTPPGFGRIAAQTAKQVIHQKIREAEKEAIMDEFLSRTGGLISGMILRFDGPNVRVDLGRTEAFMPVEERIPSERLNLNQRLSFLLKEIKETPRGKEIILSRSDPAFVEKLFAREVPEIGSGSVIIKAIAREPGVRTKIAVASVQSGVDPVGSCVGQKGVRVQAVTNELGGERVDIVPWTENLADLIIASLSPAENLSVILNEEKKTAVVKAPENMLSLVIGKEGQNVRLAARLTGWRIEVEPSEEKSEDTEVTKEEEKEKPKKPRKATRKVKKVSKKEEPEAKLDKLEKEENVSQDSTTKQVFVQNDPAKEGALVKESEEQEDSPDADK